MTRQDEGPRRQLQGPSEDTRPAGGESSFAILPDGSDVARLISLSDERDLELALRLDAWRDGWRACEAASAGQYEAGYADGCLAVKAMQHILHGLAQENTQRWILRGEPRSRGHFADLHPGDYAGGPGSLEHPGEVWVGSAATHYHQCAPACYRVRPGWYTPAEAAEIGRTLPGSHPGEAS